MNEYTELAAVLLGLDPDEVEDWEEVEQQFEAKYNLPVGEVEELLNDLLALTVPQQDTLSGELYQFFGRENTRQPGVWTAILRRKYTPVASAAGVTGHSP